MSYRALMTKIHVISKDRLLGKPLLRKSEEKSVCATNSIVQKELKPLAVALADMLFHNQEHGWGCEYFSQTHIHHCAAHWAKHMSLCKTACKPTWRLHLGSRSICSTAAASCLRKLCCFFRHQISLGVSISSVILKIAKILQWPTAGSRGLRIVFF